MIPVEQLKDIPLFASLDTEELAGLAPLFHRARYRLGDVLFAQGDAGEAFYVVQSGTLRLRQVDARGRERVLGFVSPPRSFGETSLITGLHHDATADVFSEQVELLVLSKPEFDAWRNTMPTMREKLALREDTLKKLAARPFPWLAEGEIVVVNTRRHWFALFRALWLPLVLALFLLLLAFVVGLVDSASASAFSWLAPLSTGLWILGSVGALGAIVWCFVDWSNDHYIVTNKRVIHTEKVIGFFEEREEAPIEQVTNVQESAIGLAARVLGFSAIRVETAGSRIDIDFGCAPRRANIRRNIFEQVERVRSRAQFEKREQRRAAIREELRTLLAPPELSQAPSPTPRQPPAAEPPMPVRRRRTTNLSRRLNELIGLQIEESGRITWRKHWFILFTKISRPFVALVVVLAGGLLFFLASWSQLTWQVLLGSGLVWLVVLGGAYFWMWYQYEDWRNDIYQVTEDRILDIERSPFRLKERSVETTLDRVQNVSYSKPSILANVFNYGDLTIETAGGQGGQLVFKAVTNPQWASQEIFRRRDAHRERQQQDRVRQERREYLDWFMEYHRFLQRQGDVYVLPATASPAAPPAPREGDSPVPPSNPSSDSASKPETDESSAKPAT
jgi:uncharacterized membrane protein YdbT with pleckstrin-like domain